MKLENEFTVPAPISQCWDVLLDVERVAPCLPGAALEGESDGEWAGTMTIKIGPITTRYKGTVKIEEADEAARRAVMRASARDSRGQGTAAATITSTMEEVEGGTRVHVETDMRVTGPAAQFGRGVMQDVSAKLMGRFADCLAEEIAGAPAAPPAAEEAGGAAEPTAAGATGTTAAAGETASAGGEAIGSPPAPEGARVVGPLNPAANPPPGPAGESAERAASGAAGAAAERAVGAASGGPIGASGAASGGAQRPPVSPRRSEEVLDLGAASREAVLKRVAPVAATLLGLIVLLGIRRRRR